VSHGWATSPWHNQNYCSTHSLHINANSVIEIYDSKLSVHFRELFHQLFSVGSQSGKFSQSVSQCTLYCFPADANFLPTKAIYEKSLSAAEVSIFSTVGSVFCSTAANNRTSEIGGPKKPASAAASPLRSRQLPRHLSVSVVISGKIQHGRLTYTPTDDQPFLGDRRKISRQLRYTILWRREKDLGLWVWVMCARN